MKNLSKVISLLVLALYLSPAFQSVGTLTMYFSNLGYIQNELCENRDSPELKCEGTCVLAKMMAETKSKTPIPETSLEIKELNFVIGFLGSNAASKIYHQEKSNSHFTGLNDHYSLILSDSTLDPPELLV